jgi:hypothetical protein
MHRKRKSARAVLNPKALDQLQINPLKPLLTPL